jgi:hypothetical protein
MDKHRERALDSGSHSNASLQLLPEAGAQRTLEAVSCKALWGRDLVLSCALASCLIPPPRPAGPLSGTSHYSTADILALSKPIRA